MSQLQIQIVFVAIVVLFAFDEGQDGPGPVRIKKLVEASLEDIKVATVYFHNYYRSMVARGLYPNKNGTMLPTASQMFALNWDDNLYQYAQNWADKCTFQHSNGPHGENLWMSSDNNVADGNAIRWSIGAYMNEIKECGLPSTTFDSSIDWHCVGHAMQVIWAKYGMHSVGCAVKRCPRMTITVCEYGSGNIWTLPIYNRGTPCKTATDCLRKDTPNAKCRADLGLCLVQEQWTYWAMPNSTVRL